MAKFIATVSAGCAAACFIAFLSMGFGITASSAAALFGLASGFLVARQALPKVKPAQLTTRLLDHARARGVLAERQSLQSDVEALRSLGVMTRIWLILETTYGSLPKYQRFATILFLIQATISLIAIVAFSILQSADIIIRIPIIVSFSNLFSSAYPIMPSAVFAKDRFDNLFIPLVAAYVVTMTSFSIAFVRSLAPMLREARKYSRLLITSAFFLIALWCLLFVGGAPSGGTSLQQRIVDGSPFGYIVLFVFVPLVLSFLASSLPEERRFRSNCLPNDLCR